MTPEALRHHLARVQLRELERLAAEVRQTKPQGMAMTLESIDDFRRELALSVNRYERERAWANAYCGLAE